MPIKIEREREGEKFNNFFLEKGGKYITFFVLSYGQVLAISF